MTTLTIRADVQDVIDWHAEHLGALTYDESASTRLHYKTAADLLTPTDCSGDIIRTYRHFVPGVLGDNTTYTGNLWNKGQLITTSLAAVAKGDGMFPGDLALWHWRGWSLNPGDPFNHVSLYAGGDLLYNHGGPHNGPVKQSLRSNVGDAEAVRIIRLVPLVKPAQPSLAVLPRGEKMLVVSVKLDLPQGKASPGVFTFNGTVGTGLVHITDPASEKSILAQLGYKSSAPISYAQYLEYGGK